MNWPDDKKVAVMIDIMLEGWEDGKAPMAGLMHMPLRGNTFDTHTRSWSEYGINRGIQNLTAMLQRHEVPATVLTAGVLADRYPGVLRRVADAGHEVAAHSWSQDTIPVYLDATEEADNIGRTAEAIEKATGERPIGWISPRATPSLRTSELLAEHGFTWQGDRMDDDLPYIEVTASGPIVQIPFTTEVNDLLSFVRYGQPPAAQVGIYEDAMRFLKLATGPQLLHVTVHAHAGGRPYATAVLSEIVARLAADEEVWITTGRALAQHVREFTAMTQVESA